MIPEQNHVLQEASGLDQRVAALQAQLDRLTVSLQLWRDHQEQLGPAEERLAELTRQVDSVVSQLNGAGERQARAVGHFEERVSAFASAEERLHQDAAERLRSIERVIEHEWAALRDLHEAPVRELRDHADTLTRVSIAATNTSVSGFDRAEARLVAIEAALTERLTAVSEQLAAAVAEMRALGPARPTDQTTPTWPIEGVVRLHNQLREGTDALAPIDVPKPGAGPSADSRALPAAPADVVARLDVIAQTFVKHEAALRTATTVGGRTTRLMSLVAGGVAVLVLAAVVGGWSLQRQARAATARAAAAEQQARENAVATTQQLTAFLDDAARQLAEARAGSATAHMVSDVVAAPDLVRFAIAGAGPSAMSGQVLWSRTRGVVLSGVRFAQPAPGMTYQLWMNTVGGPVTVGTFMPDTTGRITFAAEAPRVAGPVVGASVTLEPQGGSEKPSNLLRRDRVPASPAPVPLP